MSTFKKTVSIVTALTTTLWLSGVAMIMPVSAVTIVDGDLIRANGGIDVYIVKIVGAKKFKRLILNPDIFNQYGHLKWENIKDVDSSVLDEYTTSTLVRADGDTKVYRLIPNGDVGEKKWVESLDCFNSKGYDWDSVYTINNFERDSYTTSATTECGGTTPGEEGITLSLASDTPAASAVPKNAYGVTFMKVKVDGSGTISQLIVKRSGAGAVSDFDNVYLYENGTRLTSGRSISSSTGKVTFIGLDITAPTTIEVVADLSATAGNADYFEIESASDVTADTTVNGNFPIQGNVMTMSGSDAGTLTVARYGSTAYNVAVGAKEAEVSAFKVTANSEGTKIDRIQLYQSGTVDNNKLTNLKLKVSGSTVSETESINDDGYAVFLFDPPLEINKGSNKVFHVYADNSGKRDDTIIFYLDLATDIHGIGSTYGYGMKATITNYDSDTYITATLEGGDVTLAFNGPSATSIGTNTNDTVFLDYSMTAESAVEVKQTRLIWCWDDGGNGTYDNATTDFGDVEDVKIVDVDTGTVLVGPVDGDSFTTTIAACPGSKNGLYYTFTDNFDIAAGQTRHLQVTADVKTSNSGTTALGNGDVIKVILEGYGDLGGTNGSTSVMKYSGTTTAVKAADIVPSSDMSGNEMTISTASLTVGLAALPISQTVVKNEEGVDTVAFTMTTSDASPITVTALTLRGYVADSGTSLTAGKTADDIYIKNLVSSVYLYDGDGNKIAGPQGFSGTNSRDVAFSGLNWTIPAGTTAKLVVKADMSSLAASGTSDVLSFDINDADVDITCQDDAGNSVDAAGDQPNGAGSPTVIVTRRDSGTLTVSQADTMPTADAVYFGESGALFSKFNFTARYEPFYVTKLNIYSGDTAATVKKDVSKVVIDYINKDGASKTAEATMGTNASASFVFTDDADKIYVPKDSTVTVTVKADLNSWAAGAVVGNFSLDFSGGNADEFKAIGVGSGTTIEGDNTNIDNQAGTNMYVYRSYPDFEEVTLPDGATSGSGTVIGKFKIYARGYDVLFGTTAAASGTLQFDTVSSGDSSGGNVTAYLYDDDSGTLLDTATVATGTKNASVTFSKFTSALAISAGTYKTVRVEMDLSNYDDPVDTTNGVGADYFQLVLQDQANVIKWVDYSGTDQNNDQANVAGVLDKLPARGPYLKAQ